MERSSAHDQFVVALEVAEFFVAQGLLEASSGNKRKLSTSLLSSSSRPNSAKSASASFEASSIQQASEHVIIPNVLRSKDTYEFIGFNSELASDLWRRFLTQPVDMDYDFLGFATEHVRLHLIADAESDQDDWDGCLRALGVNDQLRTAILMPEFEDVRYSATCKFWVLESINSTYDALDNLNDELRMEQRRRQQEKKAGRKHAGSVSGVPPAPSPRNKNDHSSTASSSAPASSTSATLSKSIQTSKKEEQQSSDYPQQKVKFAESLIEPMSGHHMIWRVGNKLPRLISTIDKLEASP